MYVNITDNVKSVCLVCLQVKATYASAKRALSHCVFGPSFCSLRLETKNTQFLIQVVLNCQ